MRRARTGLVNSIERSGRLETSLVRSLCLSGACSAALRGVLVLLVSVVFLGWGAAGAATPQRAAFKVKLTGTLTKDWTVSRTVEGECTR